jgi:hypothetical protein
MTDPTQATAPPDDTTVVGEIDPSELQAINSLQTREQELTYRVGQMFREALSVAMQAGDANKQLQQLMMGIRNRMNVPEGQLFRITYDGKVHLVDPPEGAPQPAAPQPETTEGDSEES